MTKRFLTNLQGAMRLWSAKDTKREERERTSCIFLACNSGERERMACEFQVQMVRERRSLRLAENHLLNTPRDFRSITNGCPSMQDNLFVEAKCVHRIVIEKRSRELSGWGSTRTINWKLHAMAPSLLDKWNECSGSACTSSLWSFLEFCSYLRCLGFDHA